MKKSARRSTDRRKLLTQFETLVVAFAGGGLFALLGVPAGWMSGALVSCALASMLGMKVGVNRWMRDGIFMILGTTMGSAVTPATLASLPSWPISMTLLIASLPVIMFAIVFYLERVAGWDRRTSFFAAAPGALSAVIIMSEAAGADMRRVVFGQFIRLFLLVALIPTAIVASGHSGAAMPVMTTETNMLNLALVLAAGMAGGVIGIAIRFPAGAMVGAMLVSAVLYGSGIADERMPTWLLIIGFVVLGANSGSRFAGSTFATLKSFLLPATVAVALASGVALVFALSAAALTGDPLPKMVLAFMPGALEAMVIMAFVLDADPAFVAAHHLVRFLCLAFSLPLIVRFLFRSEDMPTDADYPTDEEVKD